MTQLLRYGLLAFWAGVLLNFVPCVLPVIPLKIRAVLHEIKGDVRSRLFAAAALLSGSLFFFLILGGTTAYLDQTWGELFQSKLFLAALSVFLFLAAVTTLSDWSVPLPKFVYKVPIHRYSGAFFTGALAGILSTPCSGPFLGSVLAYTLTQRPAIVLIIFSSIAVGLSSPYVFVLVWPDLMNRLSFSGLWTMQVKQILGFVLLSGAIFFGRVLIPAAFHTFLWWLLYGGMIIWAISVFRRSLEWKTKVVPLATIALVMVLLLLTLSEGGLKWRKYSPESMQMSLAEGRPVLLEFTAEWCLNCEVLEKTTYSNKKVIQTAEKAKLSPFRVDMTDFNEQHKTLLKSYGGTALPFALLMDKTGKVTRRFAGMFTAKTLAEAIGRL
jgi:thiol:disulfide interchange protein